MTAGVKFTNDLEDEDKGFWQISDANTPALVITEFKKLCNCKDAYVSSRLLGSTMAGFSSWFDENGVYHHNNSNWATYAVCCDRCFKSMKAHYGEGN